jgi:hypothetical protein
MINRTRAWRRRKAKLVNSRQNETHELLLRPAKEASNGRPIAEVKQHQHGKLTHAQEMRQRWALAQEMADAHGAEPLVEPPTEPSSAPAAGAPA